jgi:polar amino acid transport system substrate-binding protein
MARTFFSTILLIGCCLLGWTFLLFLAAPLGAQAATNQNNEHSFTASERLALIKQRGSLIVGVKTDYPPFGMLNSSGQPEGFEHDLAADIARRLGVKLIKVSVTTSSRLQKLQEGVVDIVLATTSDTAERRQIVTMIEPDYYASGVTLLMPPNENITSWAEIRSKTVCASQGSYYNRTMEKRYLLELQTYINARDAKLALKDGRCIGYLFDNTAVMNDLTKPEWQGYKAPLPPALVTPWAIAISAKEHGSNFDKILGDIVADWHRTGFLIEREKAWHIPPSPFLVEAHKIWTNTSADGKPFCRRGPDGNWNPGCRNKVFVTSSDVGGLTQWGLWLKERTGINLTLIYDQIDRTLFLTGMLTTLLLTVFSILGSLVFGILGAICAESGLALLALLARATCEAGRLTPPLLVMYLVLFGISSTFGFAFPAMAVVVGCLSVYTGAGVMAALLDAAATCRLEESGNRMQLSRLRKLVGLSSGSITAVLINVTKSTMMASVFAVPELLSSCTGIINERGNVGVMMNALLLTFLLLVHGVVRILQYVEHRILTRLT